MATQERLLTAEDLLRMPDDGMRHELIRGELTTMPPPGFLHEIAAARILILVGNHVERHALGWVCGAPGIIIEHDPDLVRAPDFAFIAGDRLPGGELPAGYLDLAPDLIAKVVSPSDSAREVHDKILQWLEAGVRMALVFYPTRRSVVVYRSASDIRVLGSDEVFDGADVLPGFTCPVRDFFPG